MPTPSFPLGVLLAGDPLTSSLQVGLFTGPSLSVPTFEGMTDLVELTTPGYARSGPDAWEEAEVVTENFVRRASRSIDFRCTAANPGAQALGYFVVVNDGTGPQLIDAQEFDSPRPMAAIGDNCQVQVEVEVFDFVAML